MNKKLKQYPKIRKAVIPIAGLGTRFLPWTKNIPKEMLPILNKPTIQYIVEEISQSGIEEIIFITSDAKEALVDHFDRNLFLEYSLEQKNKHSTVEELQKISKLAKIYTIRQFEPKGLGHAVLQAKTFIGDEPFALLLGDDVTVSNNGIPVLKQMINVYEKLGGSILGIQEVEKENLNKYGIIEPSKIIDERTISIKSVIEKPKIEKAPSNFAICGRYILSPTIFKYLEEENLDPLTNEIQITDSILKLITLEKENIFGYNFNAKRYDMGSKIGFIEANIEFGLNDAETKDTILKIIEKLEKKKKA